MIPAGWKKTTLGKHVRIFSGIAPGQVSVADAGQYPYVKVDDLNACSRILYTSRERVNARSGVVPAGSVIFPKRGASILTNKIRIAGAPIVIDTNMMAIAAKESADNDYIYYFILNEELHRIADVSTIPQINNKHIVPYQLALPSIQEQQRIAMILKCCDMAIESIDNLVAAKQCRRQALVQRLLTGKARLPGFVKQPGTMPAKPYPLPKDWAYPPIGEVCQEYSARNNRAKGLPVLSCTVRQGLVSSLEYFGKRVFSEETSAYKLVPRGTFAYATNHIEEGSIGYQDLYDLALISPIYTVFKTSPEVDDAFLYCLLKTEWYRQLFQKHTNASVDRRGSLRWSHFAEIPIPLPSLKEQQAIMEVIQDADREIALHRAELDALKRQKRGLMQQLLTGKVRVP